MKVFVSGQIGEKENIQSIYKRLEAEGFEITHDWTRTDDLAIEDKESKEAGIRAYKDIEGVCNAEAYIIVTSNMERGKGMYVELGAALALTQTDQNLSIYLIGSKNHPSIFYSHPAVRHCESLDECIILMKRGK